MTRARQKLRFRIPGGESVSAVRQARVCNTVPLFVHQGPLWTTSAMFSMKSGMRGRGQGEMGAGPWSPIRLGPFTSRTSVPAAPGTTALVLRRPTCACDCAPPASPAAQRTLRRPPFFVLFCSYERSAAASSEFTRNSPSPTIPGFDGFDEAIEDVHHDSTSDAPRTLK